MLPHDFLVIDDLDKRIHPQGMNSGTFHVPTDQPS